MKNLIQKVIISIDPDELDVVLADLRHTTKLLNEIEADIKEVSPEVSFWDRVNVFSKSDSERELNVYKNEQKEFSAQLQSILEELRRMIRLAIDDVYSVKLKVQLGAALRQADKLKASNSHGNAKVKGKTKLIEMLSGIDVRFSRQFGFEEAMVVEEELTEATLKEMLRRNGIVRQ